MLTQIEIDPTKHVVILQDEYRALLAASGDDSKRVYGVKTISKLFEVPERTLQDLAIKKPLLIRKDATGKYKAKLDSWKKLLGL